MKNLLVASSILSSALALPASADVTLDFSHVFPSDAKIEVTNKSTTRQGVEAAMIKIDAGSHVIQVLNPKLSGAPDAISMSFKTMTVIPKNTDSLALLINDGAARLSGQPAGADLCSWLSAIQRLEGRGAVISPPEKPEEGNSRRKVEEKGRLDLIGFSFNKAGALDCGISGVFKASRFSLTEASGTNYLLSDMDLQAIVPLMAESDGRMRNTAVRLRAGEVQYSHEKEIPSVGGLDLVVKLDLDGNSVSGLNSVVTAYDFLNDPPSIDYLATQIYNASTLLQGEASYELPVLRIYAPGVVPSEAVANFSRVGLSTITGVTSGKVTLDRGEVKARTEAKLVGIADIAVNSHTFMTPFKPEIFKALTAGLDLGWHAIPDVRLISASVELKDTGFNRAVEDLTGVPSARYAEELMSEILDKYDGPYQNLGRTALGGLTKFLRDIGDGQSYEVRFQPESLQNITQLILLGVKDLNDLIAFGNLHYKVKADG